MNSAPIFSHLNGEVANTVAVQNRGLAYGDGVFETIRYVDGVIPFWQAHMQRLLLGCSRLGIDLSDEQIESFATFFFANIVQSNIVSGVIKIIATRQAHTRGYGAPNNSADVLFCLYPSTPLEPKVKSVAVYQCQHRLPLNSALAGIKHLNRLDCVLAAQEWAGSDYQEALLLSQTEQLISANSRNLFLRRDNYLLTPSLQQAGIEGVMRRAVMEYYGQSLGLECQEAELKLEDALTADELWLTNSVTGVWQVNQIMDNPIKTGEFAQQIYTLFLRDTESPWSRYVA